MIEAAIPILARRGAAGLSLREVAKSAGVSHAAPYRHFRDKNALLVAIAARGHRQLRDGCLAAMREWPDDPRRQWIEAGLNYLYFVIENREIAQLMFGGTLPDGDPDSNAKRAACEAVQALMQLMENGKAAGLFPGKDPEILTHTSLCTIHGLAMLMSAGFVGDAALDRAAVRSYAMPIAETLWAGMTAVQRHL